MRIDVDKLATHGFKLDLAGKGPLLELGPSGALSGFYELGDDDMRIRAGVSHELAVTRLAWALEGTTLELKSHAHLAGAQVALVIPRGAGSSWSGTVAAERVALGSLELSLAAVDGPVTISGIEIEGLALDRSGERLRLKAARASIGRLSVRFGRVVLSATRVELPEGLAIDETSVSLGALRIAEVSVTVDDVMALVERRQRPVTSDDGPALDWTWLDQLNGKVDVDLMADTTVPLIGRRRATHHFRIPIAEGTIDFKALERNLSTLEDAVLDFAIRDGKLVFERDLPLVPWNQKTLVFWDLAPEELLMAKRNRVRLRRLRELQVPEPKSAPDPSKKPSVEVRSLHFDNVAIDLTLRGPTSVPLAGGRFHLGDEDAHALSALRLRGDVRYDAAGAPDRTTLVIDAEGLVCGVDGMSFGAVTLAARAIAVASLEQASLTFEGVVPRALEGALRAVELRDLALSWGD